MKNSISFVIWKKETPNNNPAIPPTSAIIERPVTRYVSVLEYLRAIIRYRYIGMEEILFFFFYFILIWKFFYFIRKFFYFRILSKFFYFIRKFFYFDISIERKFFYFIRKFFYFYFILCDIPMRENSFILLGNSFILLFWWSYPCQSFLLFY